MEDINLKERTITWMARKQYRSKGRGTFWASEASAKFTNQFNETEVVGKCHRAVYYRLQGVKPTNLPSSQSQVIFMLGNMVEDNLVEMWKQMGIWENNSVRWEDKPRNLSGEFDCILREGDRKYGVECKSFFGYYANKQILGHWSGRAAAKRFIQGRPKDEHLMQAAIYADQTRGELEGFKLFYCSRDDNEFAEFNIKVNDAGIIFINGRPEQRFGMNEVYARYAALGNYTAVPARDYTWKIPTERVEVLYARGDMSKSAYESHMGGKDEATDFHCGYCDFRDYCHGPNSETIAPVVTTPSPLAIATESDYLMHGGL